MLTFSLHLGTARKVQVQIIEPFVIWSLYLFPSLRRQSLSCTKLLSPHSSGEGEEDKPESQLSMVNREIVHRGALILFCDYVVRTLKILNNKYTHTVKMNDKLQY